MFSAGTQPPSLFLKIKKTPENFRFPHTYYTQYYVSEGKQKDLYYKFYGITLIKRINKVYNLC